METQSFKCKTCGAILNKLVEESTNGLVECPYCLNVWTIPKKDTDPATLQFLRMGEHDLDTCKFDDALLAYKKAAELDPKEPEAYFGMALAEFKVQYLKDEAAEPPRLQPICHEVSQKIFTQNENYICALELATPEQRETYLARGAEIDAIRAEFARLSATGLDYDCFLCVKVTSDDGKRTDDCDRANDIYYYLRDNGLKPFFSEREMKGKTGADYEALILYALYMSECMILVCSDESYLQTRWVKNEYTRFGAMMADEQKEFDAITIAFSGKPIERLPGKSGKLQGIDIGKPDGFARIEQFVKRHTVEARAEREAEEKRRKEQEAQILQQIEAQKAAQKELEAKLRTLEKEKSIANNPVQSGRNAKRRRRWSKKKILALVLSIVFVGLCAGGVAGGLVYKKAMDKVEKVEELISVLPDYEIKDYSQYEDLFDAALESYEGLSNFQKGKVGNRGRLLNALEGFNTYRVEKLRGFVAEISPETVEESGNLKNAVDLYAKFTADQKGMLTSDEIYALEQYKKVQEVISALISIDNDVVNKYSEVDGVKRTYLTIDPAYQNLVYNYGLIDTFAAQIEYYSSFAFTEVAGGYSMALAEGKMLSGEVELPARYNGQDIVEIPEGAFKNCRGMTSLVVPDTVQTIGKGAFEGCNNLVDITLPFTGDNVEKASSEAYGMNKVFGWIFGYETLESSGNYHTYQFNNSSGGKNVTGATWQYSYISYSKCTYYFFHIPTTLRNVTIAKQVDIPLAAFNGCTMLESVTYSATLNDINGYAFQNCSSLTRFNSETEGTADLKGNIETIGECAFAGCTLLTAVEIPESIHVFGVSAFDGDRAITELTLTNHVTQIGDYAFRGLSLIAEVTVYNSTVSIGKGAFEGCNNLVDITLPFTGDNVEKASSEAYGMNKVFGWIFGYETLESSGNYHTYQFNNSSGGKNVTGATWQYSYISYSKCTYYFFHIPTTLRNVTITQQVDIPLAAFNGCTMLQTITYTNKIMSRGDYAFQDCVQPTEKLATNVA